VKLKPFLVFNGILFAAAGIAFAMYSPLALAFFQVPELEITTATYWHMAAFARMFGAGLFGWGMLLWASSRGVEVLPAETRRGLVFALLLACLMGAIVSLTQQSDRWMTPSGWVLSGTFVVLTLVYGYFLALNR